MTTDKIEPNSCGIACEKVCSKSVQSPIIVVVRSDKSLFSKNDKGNLRRLSARFTLLISLSRYVVL